MHTLCMRHAWAQLGEQIRARRTELGLTQRELARTAQLSRIYIQMLERGERVSPSLPALERLARALRMTLQIDLVRRAPRRG
jgi:transcriptional regulator with XRE-family HTH domain